MNFWYKKLLSSASCYTLDWQLLAATVLFWKQRIQVYDLAAHHALQFLQGWNGHQVLLAKREASLGSLAYFVFRKGDFFPEISSLPDAMVLDGEVIPILTIPCEE